MAGLWLILAPWPRHATGLPRKAGEKQGWESAEDPEDIGRELEMESTAPLAPSHPIADLSAFRNMRMLYFLSAMIPVQLVFFQFTSTLPLFLVRDLHLPVSVFGSIFTLNTLMVVAIEVPLNTAMAGWSHRRTLALGALLYAIGFGSYAITTGPAGVFLGAAIWTFGEMVLMPGSAAYAAEIAPPGRRGEYMGLYTMSFNTAFSFGPFLSAEIFQRWGSHTLWSIAFISGTISAMLMSRIGTKKQPE